MRTNVTGVVVALSTTLASLSCGSNSAVPIAKIQPDKTLVDLNADEKQGVCDWSTDLANMKLPKAGTNLSCHGIAITFNGASECMFPAAAQQTCVATVSQYQACIPHIIDKIAADPCVVIDVALSGNVNKFIEETTGCQGLGPCGFIVRM
jgi:hypothetical protein